MYHPKDVVTAMAEYGPKIVRLLRSTVSPQASRVGAASVDEQKPEERDRERHEGQPDLRKQSGRAQVVARGRGRQTGHGSGAAAARAAAARLLTSSRSSR